MHYVCVVHILIFPMKWKMIKKCCFNFVLLWFGISLSTWHIILYLYATELIAYLSNNIRLQFFLDIQTEKIQWWYLNHTLDDGIIDCLAGTYKRCLMKSIEWRVGPLSFNKRGGEGRKRRDYIYDRSKIQKLFIHDCIIAIVQNSIVKWKYGWQVLELPRSCSSRDDDRQHGAVNAGHLKRYILPLWL